MTTFFLQNLNASTVRRSILIATCVMSLASVAPGERPNVVILFTDDQGTLDANCYGSTHLSTPNIDNLAATGVRFTQAYSHTVCCPARAALLTGRHPQRGGVHFWTQGDMNGTDGINMRLEELTIAEALKTAGYRTALFGKWHLGAHRDFGPKKQGFDEFFGIRDGFIDNYNHYFLHGSGFHDLYEGTESVEANGKYFPEMMVDRSLKFLDENKDNPFFLYVPFNIPHYPEQSLKRFEEKYAAENDPVRRSYAAVISTTDHYIGKIVDRLESLGLRQKTIVIFMSDNGHSEETGNRIRVDNHNSGYPKDHFYGASGGGNTGKWIGRKGQFLEGGVRVPAIISYPGVIPQGETRDQIITVMDWFPTILDLCPTKQRKKHPQLDGSSVMPLIIDPKAASKHETLHFGWGKNWAIRKGDWKLIGYHNRQQNTYRTALHNLAEANPERKDHVTEQAAIAAELQKLHDEWDRDVGTR
jgi:arylsulfatase A-like enzyme